MSLSINTFPAAASSHAAAANVANTKGDSRGLPFAAFLDEQADATGPDADAASGGDVPSGFPGAPFSSGLPFTQAADLLTGLLPGHAFGIRRLLAGKDELDADAIRAALAKDKPAADQALLLLVAHGVLQRLEALQAQVAGNSAVAAATDKQSGSADAGGPPLKEAGTPFDSAPQAAARQSDVSHPDATTERSVNVADVVDPAALPIDSFVAASSTAVAELLVKEVAKQAQADQTNAPDRTATADPQSARPNSTTVAAPLVDAIHAVTSQRTSDDPDKEFNQPSTTTAFDRKSTKTVAATALRLGESAPAFDSTLEQGAPAGAAPSLPNEDGVVSSIVQTMRMQMRDGVGTAVVNLEPDYLGPVSIAIRVENGLVTASFHAENPQVRAWMEANEPLLRESLIAQGLTLDRLHVTDQRIAEDRSSERRHQQEQEQHARQRPRRDETATFEVIV